MRLEGLTWEAWKSAAPDARETWIETAAARVGGKAHHGSIQVRGVKLVLVPGGRVELGWDGAATALDSSRRAAWEESAEFDGSFETFLRYYFGPARTVSVPPFLVEPIAVSVSELGIDPCDDDPETALPSSAEPYRGSTTFGDYRKPNALGIVRRASPCEVVAERTWLRAGDGGVAVCGGRPDPEAWYSFALAFQLRRELWADVVSESYEQAFARRALRWPNRE